MQRTLAVLLRVESPQQKVEAGSNLVAVVRWVVQSQAWLPGGSQLVEHRQMEQLVRYSRAVALKVARRRVQSAFVAILVVRVLRVVVMVVGQVVLLHLVQRDLSVLLFVLHLPFLVETLGGQALE